MCFEKNRTNYLPILVELRTAKKCYASDQTDDGNWVFVEKENSEAPVTFPPPMWWQDLPIGVQISVQEEALGEKTAAEAVGTLGILRGR